MTPRHKEIYNRHQAGEKFADLAKAYGVSRARVQQIYAVEDQYKKAVLAAPYILMLRAHSPGGKFVAGWLVKFMETKQLNTRDIVLKGAYWRGEQKGVGKNKVQLLAWALETHGDITSADAWLEGKTCLKS